MSEPVRESRPRLCEVLGVEVGERFRIGESGCEFWIEADGNVVSDLLSNKIAAWKVLKAINDPDRIIHSPRLTLPELRICEAVGARLASRNRNESAPIHLWHARPQRDNFGAYFCDGPDTWLASVNVRYFPSLRPGEAAEILSGID